MAGLDAADLSVCVMLPPMEVEPVIAALQAVPMRFFDDLATRSPTAPPKGSAGFYAWWQCPDALPGVPGTPHRSEPLELLYVGIAPVDARSRRSLRERLSNHHRSAIGSSTFRLVLTSFLWEREGWELTYTDRANLSDRDLVALSVWQRDHLHVQWVEVPEPWRMEAAVIAAMRPPLNRDHNSLHPFYDDVGVARDRLRAAARANPA